MRGAPSQAKQREHYPPLAPRRSRFTPRPKPAHDVASRLPRPVYSASFAAFLLPMVPDDGPRPSRSHPNQSPAFFFCYTRRRFERQGRGIAEWGMGGGRGVAVLFFPLIKVDRCGCAMRGYRGARGKERILRQGVGAPATARHVT